MKRLAMILSAVLLGLLAGCGGGGGGGTDAGGSGGAFTVGGTAMKGPVEFASTELFAVNSDGTLTSKATGTTFSDGGFSLLTLSPSATGYYLIEVRGGLDNSRYRDEVTGTFVPLAAGDRLQAIFKDLSGVDQVTVTPLTTMAARRALALIARGVDLATAVESSNASLSQQFGIPDVVHTLPVDASDAESSVMGSMVQRSYGLVLGGLSLLAGDNSLRAIDLAEALARDAQDGILDGQDEGLPLSVATSGDGSVPMSASLGFARWKTRADDFAGGLFNQTNLMFSPIIDTPLTLGSTSASALRITTTTLPAWIEGEAGAATFEAAGGTPPYTWSGTPPSPWSLNGAAGEITGTAPLLAPGSNISYTAPFTVTVSDAAGATAQGEFRIITTRQPPVLTLTASALTVEEGVAFSEIIGTATGGTQPYRFRLASGTGFPPFGLNLDNDPGNPDNVILGGTQSADSAGTYIFGVCVVDAVGNEDCAGQTITLTIQGTEPPPGDGGGTTPGDGGTVSGFDGSYTGGYHGCRMGGAGTVSEACSGGLWYFGTMQITIQNGQVSGTGADGETLTGTITSSGGAFDGQWNNNIGTSSFQVTAGSWGPSLVSGANADVTESVSMIID
jgi:hypothetical protein